MKKVFLTGVSVAAIFAAGPALASDSVVTQNGLGNDATVNQTGSTGDTDSTVTQIGDNNVAGVTQSGDNNNVTISQTQKFIPPAEEPSHEAPVTQEAVGGGRTTLQEGHTTHWVPQAHGSRDDEAINSQ